MSEKDIKKAEEGFFDKMRKFAGMVPFATPAVEIYYCMIDSNTPLTIKMAAAAPLVYFISPIDAIPDAIPVAGLTDDAGVVYAAYKYLEPHITEEHKEQARNFFLKEEKVEA